MTEILGVSVGEVGLAVIAIGSLFVLRRMVGSPNAPTPTLPATDAVAWLHTRRSLVEALELRGFHVSDEDAAASRLVLERADASVSVSWDARRREVDARLVWRSPAGADNPPGTHDLTRNAYMTTCYLPREGAADGAIARLLEDLAARVDDRNGV